MSQNVKYHAEIRNWNTAQLINVLNMNGLSDCCDAIKSLEIDGESFLNLTEGQLAFWRKYLNHVQVRRFWSVIQLARENPKDFVGDVNNKMNVQPLTPHHEIERNHSSVVRTLENILGQRPAVPPSKNLKQDDLHIYENNDIIMQLTGKLPYKKLPPKPQQDINNTPKEEYLPMKPTENEKQILQKRLPPKPIQYVQPTVQYPKINKLQDEGLGATSFLHSKRIITTNEVVNVETPSNDSTNRFRPVPSPNSYSRPLPVLPTTQKPFPLPPNIPILPTTQKPFPLPPNIPILPNWQSGSSGFSDADEEEFPYYVDVDHYKTKEWYKDIDRKQAIHLLKGKPNGTFIARPSNRENHECSLSIIYESRIYNLAVTNQDDKLIIGGHEFNSVNEIIDHFMQNEMGLNGLNNEDIFVTLRPI